MTDISFNEVVGEDDCNAFVVSRSGNTVGYRLSRLLSLIFHPFVISTLVTTIVLFSSTGITIIPLRLKLYFIALVALNTLFIPLSVLLIMRYFGLITSLELPTRKERILPLMIVVSCYVLCAVLMPVSIVSYVISKFLFATIGCVIAAFIINIFWKVSLHLIAFGGLCAMLIYSFMYSYGVPVWMFLVALVLSGALASARLYLGFHNTAQVAVGYCIGFVISMLIIYL